MKMRHFAQATQIISTTSITIIVVMLRFAWLSVVLLNAVAPLFAAPTRTLFLRAVFNRSD
jgi:hypothetical protein